MLFGEQLLYTNYYYYDYNVSLLTANNGGLMSVWLGIAMDAVLLCVVTIRSVLVWYK